MPIRGFQEHPACTNFLRQVLVPEKILGLCMGTCFMTLHLLTLERSVGQGGRD